MGERRKARRYEVYLPVQVCTSRRRPVEFHTAQLRDISRTGVYFHSNKPIEPGTKMELTFQDEVAPVYGIAATIERIDFVRPVVANAAA
jgi:hypothetical protein